jgi:hypothetical protein
MISTVVERTLPSNRLSKIQTLSEPRNPLAA